MITRECSCKGCVESVRLVFSLYQIGMENEINHQKAPNIIPRTLRDITVFIVNTYKNNKSY